MIIKHRGFEPKVDNTSFIAPTAVIVGKVKIAPRSRVMYGAVIDSEGSSVEIGECTIVCENAVLRATASGSDEHCVSIGNNVFIGPHATLLGCTVESNSYVATGATVLQGAVVHSGVVVTVGALVHANTVVPSGTLIPPNCLAIGNPLKIYSPDEKEALSAAIKGIGFANTAFGINNKVESIEELYKATTEIRSKEFESHFYDEVTKE